VYIDRLDIARLDIAELDNDGLDIVRLDIVIVIHNLTVSKLQFSVDHTAMYDIALLVVFQLVRDGFANNVFY